MAVAVIAFIVFMERAQRRLLIQYPKRQVGNKMFEGAVLASAAEAQHLGRDPADLRLVAAAAADHGRELQRRQAARNGFQWITTLARPRPAAVPDALSSALIMFFAFFYTAIVFNPTETADNLKKHGGFIPGIRPGERTAEYIDYVLIAHHGARRDLSRDRLPDARNPDFLRLGAVLLRRHVAADRRQRDHGYGGADPGLSARAPV